MFQIKHNFSFTCIFIAIFILGGLFTDVEAQRPTLISTLPVQPVPALNAPCSKDEDCTIKNATCQNNRCQCPFRNFLDNDTCYRYTDALNGVCHSDESCKDHPFTKCTNGRCRCLPNYGGNAIFCLGKMNANATCNSELDCLAINAICDGTCQCPPDFYDDSDRCYQIPLRIEAPVDSPKGCQYLPDTYYSLGMCYAIEKNLGKPCNFDQHCTIPYSECFDNSTCLCKPNYLTFNQKCYGLTGSECSTSQDCPTVWLTCVLGTCQMSSYLADKKFFTSKSGATVRIEQYTSNVTLGRSYNYTDLNGVMATLTGSNLAWSEQNHPLDKAALPLEREGRFTVIWCHMKINGTVVVGKITEPGDGLCRVNQNGQNVATAQYALLIDRGTL